MGSWNETCALTRHPILTGDPVIKFHTLSIPSSSFDYKHEMGSTPMLLGLFSRGDYDDYGHVNLMLDELTVNNELWCQHALATNNFWRAVSIEGADNQKAIAVQAHQLSYGLVGGYQLLSAPGETFHEYSSWLDKACAKFTALNKNWADATTNQIPHSMASLLAMLELHGSASFEERWPTFKGWMHAKDLLLPTVGHILIHAQAFDSVVKSASSAKTTKKWLKDWNAWKEIDDSIAALGADKGWLRPGAYDWSPLTKLYRTNDTPIHSHYWHTVEPRVAMERISMDDLIQYNAFKYGLLSTRANLTAGHAGGQGSDRRVLTKAVASVRTA